MTFDNKKNPIDLEYSDFQLVKKILANQLGINIQNSIAEMESADYSAAEFNIDRRLVKFRSAKITPTKVGQFVTFWKRIGKGPIMPFSNDDPFDLLIVSVRSANNFGLFIFPKKVLSEKAIISTDKKEGKRAMRVYPPWDKTDNPQAIKTQSWQLKWFVNIPEEQNVETSRLKRLIEMD